MYKERKYKKRLHRNRPFLLLGNQIDGRLFCEQIYQFKNFKNLKEQLPAVMQNIKGEGEWSFELYQVPKDYRIWHRYGYYKYPSRGIKIFNYDYMSLPHQAVKFHEKEIIFVGARVDDLDFSEANFEIVVCSVKWDWDFNN